MDSERKQRLIVGITGSSGAIYGIRLLEVLQQIDGIETVSYTHLTLPTNIIRCRSRWWRGDL